MIGAFVVTTGFRYLTLADGFPNDHFVYITAGWQMLFGEWPTRDWVDPGLPLMFALSALAQAVVGKVLLAEALVVSIAFGLAASLTVAAVLELTGSLGVAILATALEVAVFPRTYGYPKVLVYAAVFWCMARYINRPTVLRAVAIAVAVVVAFLFRHDHGIFLGIGGALTILMSGDGVWRTRLRSLVVYAAAGTLLVLPYLAYVQVYGGIGSYIRTGIEFSQREAARQWHVWPAVFGDADPLASALVYEFYVVPFVALAVLAVLRHDKRRSRFAAQVVPLCVVALMANYNFIRDPLVTRLPDAIVPAVMLVAWVLMRALETKPRRPFLFVAGTVALVVFSASVVRAGDLYGNINRTSLLAEWDHPLRLLGARTSELRQRFAARQIPTRATARLIPFFEYLDRCSTPDHRLLVGGYLVELPFFAQRRFAAGQAYFGGSFGGDDGQHLALRRLRQEVVPFAIIPSDYASDIESTFYLIDQYLRARYTLMTEVPVSEELDVRILVDSTMVPSGRDADTGWPCFR
jgi:hypothetical protein